MWFGLLDYVQKNVFLEAEVDSWNIQEFQTQLYQFLNGFLVVYFLVRIVSIHSLYFIKEKVLNKNNKSRNNSLNKKYLKTKIFQEAKTGKICNNWNKNGSKSLKARVDIVTLRLFKGEMKTRFFTRFYKYPCNHYSFMAFKFVGLFTLLHTDC